MDAYAPYIVGALLTVFIFMIKRLFRTNDLLFQKCDEMKREIERLKFCLVSDPSKTAIFEALSNGEKRQT